MPSEAFYPKASPRKPRNRRPAPDPLDDRCALFLDVDGTLLELSSAPDRVSVDPEIGHLLLSLAAALDGAVALITGRSIGDVDRLFGHSELPVAGLHGSERRSIDGSIHRHEIAAAELTRLRNELARFAARHKGLLFEDKGVAFAIHYRRVPALASLVHRTLRRHIGHPSDVGWHLQRGKGILEIRPEGRDKGVAIADYLREPPFAGRSPVFVGDDLSDEFGFDAVTALGGRAVKVGPGPTNAMYRLRDVADVRRWLAESLAGKKGNGAVA